MSNVVGTGIDVVEVERIRQICQRREEKLFQRVFTEEERNILKNRSGDPAPRIAARFAAKEAVLKSLGWGIGPAALREVEILSGSGGIPKAVLHGAAWRKAQEEGVGEVLVSLSHEKTVACAQATALARE